MQVFTHLDFTVYFLVAYLIMLHDFGVTAVFLFALENIYFVFLQLPFIYVTNRCLKPYPYQSPFSQRSTGCGFIIKELVKYHFSYLQDKDIGRIYFDGRVFRIINKFRYLRNFGGGLSDTVHENIAAPSKKFKEIKGTWIYSKSRASKQPHDVIFFFIHGGLGFGLGNGHMYTEYLSIFNVMLLQMGFSNPGIFVPEFPISYERYPNQLAYLMRCYQYIATSAESNCKIVIMGDSTGATLTLALLKCISGPSDIIMERLNSNDYGGEESSAIYSPRTFTELRKPSTAILISPITNILAPNFKQTKDDYLSPQILKTWVNNYVPNELRNTPEMAFINPGQCSDDAYWRKTLPKNGIIVSYGSEESLAVDTEAFIDTLKKTGMRIWVDKQVGQVHDWAMLNFYTDKSVAHRELSLRIYSGLIAGLILPSLGNNN